MAQYEQDIETLKSAVSPNRWTGLITEGANAGLGHIEFKTGREFSDDPVVAAAQRLSGGKIAIATGNGSVLVGAELPVAIYKEIIGTEPQVG